MGESAGYIPVSSSFLPDAELEAVIEEYAPAFEDAGVSRAGGGDLSADRRLVVFVVTGGTEERVLGLAEARDSVAAGAGLQAAVADGAQKSILLVAYPGRNSLPAALEVLARLQQDGVDGHIVFLDGPTDAAGIERLRVAVDRADAGLRETTSEAHVAKPPGRHLAGSRVGLVGEPSDWLVASSPSPEVVQDVWGASVIEIGMDELRERVDSCDLVSAEFFAEAYWSWASRVCEPADADLVASGAIYVALRSLVDELELDAISVRCFDLVVDRGATGCLALSRLADQGIVAGCEGDLPSALAMLWVRERLGETSWMANPARVDVASNTVTLAHCTVPSCMVSGYALRSHFESGLGAAVQGSIPTGPVTLVRLGGMGLDRVWLTEGEVTARGIDDAMCRTQVKVTLRDRVNARVTDLLEHPLGNHLVLVRGWVADALLETAPERERDIG